MTGGVEVDFFLAVGSQSWHRVSLSGGCTAVLVLELVMIATYNMYMYIPCVEFAGPCSPEMHPLVIAVRYGLHLHWSSHLSCPFGC